MDGQRQQGQAPQGGGGGGMVDELRRRAASMGQPGQPPVPRPPAQGVQPGGMPPRPPQAAPGGNAFGFGGFRSQSPPMQGQAAIQRPPMPQRPQFGGLTPQAQPSAQMVINHLVGGPASQQQAAMPQQQSLAARPAMPMPQQMQQAPAVTPQAMPQQGAMSPEAAQSIINRVAGGQAPMGPPPNPLAAQAAPIPPQSSQRPPLPLPTEIAPPPSQLGQPMLRPQVPGPQAMPMPQQAPMMAGPQAGVLAQMPMGQMPPQQQQAMSPADAQRSRLAEYVGG